MGWLYIKDEDVEDLSDKIEAIDPQLASMLRTSVQTKLDRLFIEAAQKKQDEGTLEVDSHALVSVSDDNGAYVMGWFWVADDELPAGTFEICTRCGCSNSSVELHTAGGMLCDACSEEVESASPVSLEGA